MIDLLLETIRTRKSRKSYLHRHLSSFVNLSSFSPRSSSLYLGSIWIQYMHFLRRTEGLMAARRLFIRAKSHPKCPYTVFLAAAFMEAHHNTDERMPMLVKNIFEKGSHFLTHPAYVKAYIDWLVSRNDYVNARSLITRALITIFIDQASNDESDSHDSSHRRHAVLSAMWDLKIQLESRFVFAKREAKGVGEFSYSGIKG